MIDIEKDLLEYDGMWIKRDDEGNCEPFTMADLEELLKIEKSKDAFNEGERSMARGILRRIKSGLSLNHIKLVCEAINGPLKTTKNH